MDLQEAYMQGFCKTASAAGVDPYKLVKIAGFFDSIIDFYRNQDDATKRAILGGLATGAGTYFLSDGGVGSRLTKSLIGGLAGGGLTYGLDRAGVLDKVLPNKKRSIFQKVL
jgi:hypothetical protein